jgi:hypothetical protein
VAILGRMIRALLSRALLVLALGTLSLPARADSSSESSPAVLFARACQALEAGDLDAASRDLLSLRHALPERPEPLLLDSLLSLRRTRSDLGWRDAFLLAWHGLGRPDFSDSPLLTAPLLPSVRAPAPRTSGPRSSRPSSASCSPSSCLPTPSAPPPSSNYLRVTTTGWCLAQAGCLPERLRRGNGESEPAHDQEPALPGDHQQHLVVLVPDEHEGGIWRVQVAHQPSLRLLPRIKRSHHEGRRVGLNVFQEDSR